MAAIDLEGVNKAFGDVVALDHLSLSIEAGELYGLLGPNGAGKTTAMEVMTGQLLPDSGTVRVLDLDPTIDPIDVRSRVGILPERESPPSFLTPREYFDFVATVRGLSLGEVDAGIDRWAAHLDLLDHLDTLATDLSRGQQQKVMLASAFLHDPDVVFIDEPLTNLDPIAQEWIKGFLRDYHEAGHTIVLSTHNVAVAGDICSSVGIMHQGRLVANVDPGGIDPGSSLLDVFVDEVATQGRPRQARRSPHE